ncbi:OmpA family protein [Catellatospora sichuanensis]|uniref:OmpA family protein n=1 Tax=Catellatospora sichuanensis TaxID=1969805 RepID=UPI001183154C|nr:OmpA family protein [Catellatospora sichuanensis]
MADNARRFHPVVGVAVAVLGLAGIVTAQHLPFRENIQDDLTTRSEQALQAAGLSSVQVDFVGRDGTLKAGSTAEADRALEIVRGLEGVRAAVADVPAVAAPAPSASPTAAATPPTVVFTLGGGRIAVTGTVPSEAARTALVQAATELAGAGQVDDRLTVDAAVTDAGLSGLPNVVKALGKGTKDATVELRGGNLSLAGTLDSQATKDAVAAAAAQVGATVADRTELAKVQQALVKLPAVTFLDNSTTLTAAGRAALTQAARILTDNPQVKVRIEGHTDNNGSTGDNLALSRARAKTVLTFLVSQGIAADRLTAQGYGESRPARPNTSEANQAVNRRVEFIVLP